TYAYYLGYDWRDAFRALRIDELLRQREQHDVRAMQAYQADVLVGQLRLFAPLLDTLDGLSERAEGLRTMLLAWDGNATVDAPEPLVLDEFLLILQRLAWDEPIFAGSTPERVTDVAIANMRNGRTVRGDV